MTAVLVVLAALVFIGPSSAAAQSADGKVHAGTTLIDQTVRSPDGRYRLSMQADGNLVLYGPGGALWSTSTNGPNRRLVMQGDGNLVVYTGSTAVWNSRTGGFPGAHLAVQNDGNLVIYGRDGRPLWTRSNGRMYHRLLPGATIRDDRELVSPNLQYRLRMQRDGNLVLYRTGTAVWATSTNGPNRRLVMQTDGNLVIYNGTTAVWHTRTGGNGGADLRVQDDGNVVVYVGNRAVWARTGLEERGRRGALAPANQGFPGYCTWWVYERARDVIGSYPRIGGNAFQMGTNAVANGWTVSAKPRARSILVRQPGVGGADGRYGHVMWVKRVDGGRVLISDMNANGGLGSVRDDVWVSVAASDRFVLID